MDFSKLKIIAVITIVLCLGLAGINPHSALAGIFVADVIGVNNQRVFLSAQTRGKLFVQGGELVEFFIDGKSLGKTLSGGDGFAYKPFTPAATGLFQIRVSSASDDATGLFLCLEKDTGFVAIDVEGSLFEGVIPKQAKRGSRKAVKKIAAQFPIVFVQTSFLGRRIIKLWLQKNKFMSRPLIPWRKGAGFESLSLKGIRVHAIIGAPAVIDSAKHHKPLAFSFEPVQEGETVGDWDEILEKMKIP
ncbi:MAG: hypothetical protein V3S66_02585 [Desulfobacterales bacterium]